LRFRHDKSKLKAHEEFAYWRSRLATEGGLSGPHFEYFFTEFFGLDREFYSGRRILDIGCGPRGSLEWASEASLRIGLDPLASRYRELGIDRHAMTYVEAGAESIPFDDGYFDIVSSFNSLDHVDDLTRTIGEIKRVLAPGGTFLLVSDVNHEPTPTEPICFSWDIVDVFRPEMTPVDVRHFEKAGDGIYQSVSQGVAYDHTDGTRRYGILAARLLKHDSQAAPGP
jgi:SAM-dependent methyltransferase